MRRACAARLARGRRGGGGIALCGAHTRVADLRISQYIGLMRVNFSPRMRPDLPEVSFCSSLRSDASVEPGSGVDLRGLENLGGRLWFIWYTHH